MPYRVERGLLSLYLFSPAQHTSIAQPTPTDSPGRRVCRSTTAHRFVLSLKAGGDFGILANEVPAVKKRHGETVPFTSLARFRFPRQGVAVVVLMMDNRRTQPVGSGSVVLQLGGLGL